MNQLMVALLHGWEWSGRLVVWPEGNVEIELRHRQAYAQWMEIRGMELVQ